jgi:coenzyme F420-reducing hydrogenase delta subunit
MAGSTNNSGEISLNSTQTDTHIQDATGSANSAPSETAPVNLIAFCCNWCSYAGADLAGVSRLQYPTNVKIIRVMCTGRIEPEFLLHAFELGIDGVLVCGCHIGDCHYISGNKKAEERINMLKNLMNMIGIDPGRLRLEWISASEGTRFADTIKDFKEQIEKLGKNKIKISQARV